MTHAAKLHPAGPPPDDETELRPADYKSILFCPECGHESVIDGDWIVEDDHDERVRDVSCPRCSTHITGRPLPEDRDTDRPSDEGSVSRAVNGSWTAWTSVWLSTVQFWARVSPSLASARSEC